MEESDTVQASPAGLWDATCPWGSARSPSTGSWVGHGQALGSPPRLSNEGPAPNQRPARASLQRVTVTACPLQAGTAICRHACRHTTRHSRAHIGTAMSLPSRRAGRKPGRSGRHRHAHATSAQRHFYYKQVRGTAGAPAPARSPRGALSRDAGLWGAPGLGNGRAGSGQPSPSSPGVPCCLHAACTPLLGPGRPSSSGLGSAGDLASGLGTAPCRLPLLLFAPLDVPVGLDDTHSLLLHDAPASH